MRRADKRAKKGYTIYCYLIKRIIIFYIIGGAIMMTKARFLFINILLVAATAFGQTASRTDGVNVFYYDSLHEAFAAAEGASIEQPDEITLLADVVLDEPLTVDEGIHIRLVAGGSDRTIRRSASLIEFPVIWVTGEASSLSLGKPGMEFELVIDGGYLNSQPIEAHCPLVAVSGPDSKLIMYDKVVLQNNYNNGTPSGINVYANGAGVFIRTEGDDTERSAEFLMKGGVIRGNINDIQTTLARGGGVFIAGFGLFTMEGGFLMNNTARITGGALHLGSRASFKKTGGIIYGANAPAGYRNTALTGDGSPKTYGHAVSVAIINPTYQYRNDTVGENDNLSYAGVPRGNGTFGTGDKWDNPDKAFQRMLAAIILPVLAVGICLFFVLRKRALKKLMKMAQEAKDSAPEMLFENANLTDREKEIGPLLLSELKMKDIASVMKIAYTTADFHAKNLYEKLNVQGRTELLVKMRS
jgi:DNA-binding CsgD family transcriptional regulator